MKSKLIYCDCCSNKCKLRLCDEWKDCNKACCNIMTERTKKLLRYVYKIDLDKL